jgi:hypothetical protein
MILLFNHLPVSIKGKIDKLVQKAILAYGSDYYDVQGSRWKGDQLTTQSLLPDWVYKASIEDSSNSIIVTLIKNYLRWLMSVEHGYGATPEWSSIRDAQAMDSIFLEALAEYYFPGADFGSDPLSNILPNIRRFSIKIDDNYFAKKGTPDGIKYALTCLFGLNPTTTSVVYSSPGIITISSSLDSSYRDFVNTYIAPAGVIVLYQ